MSRTCPWHTIPKVWRGHRLMPIKSGIGGLIEASRADDGLLEFVGGVDLAAGDGGLLDELQQGDTVRFLIDDHGCVLHSR